MIIGNRHYGRGRQASRCRLGHSGVHIRAVSGGDVRPGMSTKMRERDLVLFVIASLRGRMSKKMAIYCMLD